LLANTPVTITGGDKIQAGPFEMVFEEIAVVAEKPAPKPKPKSKSKPKPKPKPEPKPEPPEPAGPPSLPPPPPAAEIQADYSKPPPGLSITDSRYMQYLPGIYHTDFMARFLAIFEAVLTPIEWNVDNFDLYLNPSTTPPDFLPWLAGWFSVTFDSTWSGEQQRLLLAEAHKIFARRGTRWALTRVLEIYTGAEPEIIDQAEKEDPFTFTVKLPVTDAEYQRDLIEQIVDTNKPAHTNYKLQFKKATGKKKS
jgi:phage tail-like protein